jgi:putative FmdB family regulatory protein
MPVYTYKCKNCEQRFEVRQRFSDEPVKDCPHCHVNGDVRRVISQVGLVFKGSGFYVTDNRGNSPNGRANGGAKSKTSDDKSSDGKKSESSTSEKAVSDKKDSKSVSAGQSS